MPKISLKCLHPSLPMLLRDRSNFVKFVFAIPLANICILFEVNSFLLKVSS